MLGLDTLSLLDRAAGSDTSATSIRATMLCLMQSPGVPDKLLTEIDQAMIDHKIPSGCIHSQEGHWITMKTRRSVMKGVTIG